MSDYTTPKPRTRRGFAFGVVVAGALLMVCAVLPWAGVEARSEFIGSGISNDMRGVDQSYGIYTMVAGLAALAFGAAGLVNRRWLASLAAIPGALAVLVLVMFLSNSSGSASLEFGRLLSVEPVIRFGWYAALASSVAVILTALLSLIRR